MDSINRLPLDLPRRYSRTRPLREGGPRIFGEEIADEEHCCVWALTAAPKDPAPGGTFVLNGVTYMQDFGRTIGFELVMGNAADAQKVRIIQYWKDEIYQVAVGTPNETRINLNRAKQPTPDPGWSWVAGADGWTVDSNDPNRCWPEAGITRADKLVSWQDTPTPDRVALQAYVDAHHPVFAVPPHSAFPHRMTTLFKTDIFCSEKNVCDEVVAQNQETPIASVAWRQNYTFDVAQDNAGRWLIVATPEQILVDQIVPVGYRWCKNSPNKPA